MNIISKEIKWFPFGNKPEGTELLYGIQLFQDGEAFSFERACRNR